MAIKNTALGGTDWATNDFLTSTDLNDTFDAAFNKITALSAFWLNPDLYDVYDDFSAYTADTCSLTPYTVVDATTSITTGALYDVTVESGTNYRSTFSARNSTNAGGSGQEGLLKAVTDNSTGLSATVLVKLIALGANKHTWMRVYNSHQSGGANASHSLNAEVSFNGGTNYDVILTSGTNDDQSASGPSQILVVAKGSDEYDCYIGGKLIRTVTDASFEIWLRCSAIDGIPGKMALFYIDDIRQSKGSI